MMFPYLPRLWIIIFMSLVQLKDRIPSTFCFLFLFINFFQDTLYPLIFPLGSLGSTHLTSKDSSRFEFGQVTSIASPGTRMFEELAIYQYQYISTLYIDNNIWHLHSLSVLTTSVNAKYYHQYTLTLHQHYHLINIYTELAPKLSATASVAQW